MVEVLKKGELKKYTIKCCYCGSILRFTRLDEKENFTIDSGFEGNSSDWHVECPNCKTKVPTRAITELNSYDWRTEEVNNDTKNDCVKVKKRKVDSGYDCWGRREYETVYDIVDENGEIIYTSEHDPTKLVEYFQNKSNEVKV